MISIDEFLSNLMAKDIVIRLDDEKLKISSPKGALTQDLKEELIERKEELIDYLKESLESDISKTQIKSLGAQDNYPASYEQERLFFLDKFAPDSLAYSNSVAWSIKGNLNIDYLKKGLQEILNKHDSLRASFDLVDGEVIQKVKDYEELNFVYKDISNFKGNIEEEADRLISEEFNTPMNLKTGPLLRVLLVKLGEEDFVLEINPHHIISDGWSWSILFNELNKLYSSYVRGEEAVLEPLKTRFVDYAAWQKDTLKGQKLKKELSYWRKKIEGAPSLLKLPYDFNRPKVQTYCGERRYIEIPEDLTEVIKEISIESKSSLFITLLTFVNMLFYAETGSKDISIGTAVSNRNNSQVEDIIGFFVNTLVLRNELQDDMSFKDFLLTVKDTCLEALANQDMPFEKLVKEMNIARNTSYPPLIQTMFVLQDIKESDLHIADLDVKTYNIKRGTIRFDLEIYLWEEDNKLKGYFEYNTDLFKLETVERMVENFFSIINKVSNNMDKPLKELTLLSDEEYKKVVYDFNDTKADFDESALIHGGFEKQVKNQPNHIAISTGNEEVTYIELENRANRVQNLLLELNEQKGDLVGISMNRSVNMVQGMLGILKCGCTYVPFEPNIPKERINKMLANDKMSTIITDSEHLDMFLKVAEELKNIKYIIVSDADNVKDDYGYVKVFDKKDIDRQKTEKTDVDVNSEMNAYIIFTSGSTGTPKGVVIKHKSAINLIEWVNETYNINPSDKELFVTSPGFDLSVYDMFGILAAGATIRLVEKDDLTEPKQLLNIIESEGITLWDSAPQKLQQVVPFFKEINMKDRKSSLKHAFLSGDWIPLSLPTEVQKYFPNVQVVSFGGATECSIWSNYYNIGEVGRDWPSIPYGKPIKNSKYYILDSNLKPCPIGVAGDLYIGGECLAVEYLNDKKLTDEKFIKNPFCHGEKMYKTGDLARWHEDGNMEFLGRSDFQVKIRGYRIELGDIESCLLHDDDIKQVVVIDITENQNKYLCAYYVSDKEFTSNELKDMVMKKLPDYMVPSYFVKLDEIPMTVNGKVDRKSLPKPDKASGADVVFEEASSSTEKKIAAIWKEALKLDKIGINDDFFVLGGQSLLAAEVIEKMNVEFNADIPLKEIFDYPNIKGLAKYLDENSDVYDDKEEIPVVKEEEFYEASFAEKYVLELRDPNKITLFNEAALYEVEGGFDYNRVQETFNKLIERQEALRIRFDTIDNKEVQIIDSPENVNFKVKYAETSDSYEIKKIVDNFAKPFDISKAPLFDAQVIKVSDEKSLFMFNVDHVIFDGKSRQIFIEEFSKLYRGESLEELKIRYRDYSCWNTNEILSDTKGKKLKEYWENEYPTLGACATFPRDFEPAQGEGFNGEDLYFTIDKETGKKLKDLATELRTTLYMVLQSQIKVLIYKATGEKDISIGSAAADRKHKDLFNIIGAFFNMIPIRNKLADDMTFRQLVSEVKTKTLGAIEHSEYPIYLTRGRFNRTNPYRVLILWEDVEEPNFIVPGLTFKRQPFEYENSSASVCFSINEKDDLINIRFSYPGNVYRKETINKYAEDLLSIVNKTIDNVDIKLKDMK